MPTEHILLTDHQIVSLSEWQNALDREAYPLRLLRSYDPLALSTLVECVFGNTPTRFAMGRQVSSPEPEIDLANERRRPSRYRILFSETGDEPSGLAATLAAIAYATVVGGVFSEGDDVIEDLDKIRIPLRGIVPTMLDLFGSISQS